MLKNIMMIGFLLGFGLQVQASEYECFRCITAPVNRTENVKEVTTCDIDRVFDLQHTERYQCEQIQQ